MAGSLLTTMVMYGMSMLLGIAGIVEGQIVKRKHGDTFSVTRACIELAVGVSSTAVVVFMIVIVMTLQKDRKAQQLEKKDRENYFSHAESSHRSTSESFIDKSDVYEKDEALLEVMKKVLLDIVERISSTIIYCIYIIT